MLWCEAPLHLQGLKNTRKSNNPWEVISAQGQQFQLLMARVYLTFPWYTITIIDSIVEYFLLKYISFICRHYLKFLTFACSNVLKKSTIFKVLLHRASTYLLFCSPLLVLSVSSSYYCPISKLCAIGAPVQVHSLARLCVFPPAPSSKDLMDSSRCL